MKTGNLLIICISLICFTAVADAQQKLVFPGSSIEPEEHVFVLDPGRKNTIDIKK